MGFISALAIVGSSIPMSSAPYRPISPTGPHVMDPMRASTGTVQLSSSYDPSSATRYSGYPSSVPYMSSYDPRYLRDPKLEAHPVSSHTYRDHGHGSKIKTEYAIRPRTRSSTMSVVTDDSTPAPYNGSVARASPVITSDPRRSFSPLPGKDSYVVPAASPRFHHNPNLFYTDYASDTGRLDPRDRAPKTHLGYSVHRRHDSRSAPWRYPPADGLRKGEDLDKYNAYSYTNPREQFERESVARLHHERSQYRRERPLSLTGIDDNQLIYRKEPRSMGPPPSQRGFDKLERDGRSRRSIQGSAGSDVDLGESHRSSRHRLPVHLHQDPDEGYSSFREDLEERHRRHRRHKRRDDDLSSRQSYDEGPRPALPPREPMASGALIPADKQDPDSRTDHRRSRTSDTRDQVYGERGGRPRRVSRRRAGNDSDAYSSDEDLKNYRREPSAHRKQSGSDGSTSSSDRASPYLAVERPRRPRSHSRRRPRDSSPGPQESPRQDLVRRVDSSSPSDIAPKGILKPPRDKFPEEPNPIREGVAPLKDAHKKGIPPGARWTKIDRRLVNPAALEAGKERFEERADYVIVLRVLSKEEIQAYALKTQEVRGMHSILWKNTTVWILTLSTDTRYREYVRERRRRRDDDRRRGRATDDFSSDDEDEADSPLGSDGSENRFNSKPKEMVEIGKST